MSAVGGESSATSTSGPGDPRAGDDPFVGALDEVADHLASEIVPRLGSLSTVRERHLTDAVKAVLRRRSGKVPTSSVVPVPGWPSLGKSGVDVVVPEGDNPLRPQHVLELKWCQPGNDKVYEAIWDLFKVALLTRLDSVESAYLVTGAPVAMWSTAFCRDIFEGGNFESEQLCSRVFPTSKAGRLAWDHLLWGGNDRFPDSVPMVIETRLVARSLLTYEDLSWEIRAVSVHPCAGDVAFDAGWPHGRRPAGPRPAKTALGTEARSRPADGSLERTALGSDFDEAVSLARTLHSGHVRKGTAIPYLAHLLGVSALVLEDGGDEGEAVAALLHDAVEDQGGARTLEQIRRTFGDRVADIVDACSDSDVVPKPPWRERKEAYIQHLKSAGSSTLRVSLADKLHNARAILFDLRNHGGKIWQRFSTESADDQLWYYGELARVFGDRAPSPMAAELDRTVAEIAVVHQANLDASL